MTDTRITVSPGPLLVKGPVDLQDVDGNSWQLPEGKSVALCRCGQSGHKPFCDGTHGKVSFDGACSALDG